MEEIELVIQFLTLLVNLFITVYTVHRDKKDAAATRNSDGEATQK